MPSRHAANLVPHISGTHLHSVYLEGLMNINQIVVAGAGTMGYSMAQIFARYGYQTTVYDIAQEPLDAVREHIAQLSDNLVANDSLTSEERAQLLARISYTTNTDCFASCDMVVESIVENLEVKRGFYRQISPIVRPDAIVATNTSGLSINKNAEAVANPERFIGMHWFNPSNIIPLIEIIRGDATTDATAQTAREVALSCHKKPVTVNKDVPGFAANRIQFAVLREALHMVEEGIIDKQGVDDVMRYGLGLRYACLGPLAIADFGGLDTFYHIASYLNRDLCSDAEPSQLLKELYESGSYGVKSGKGFYSYEGDQALEATQQRDAAYLSVARALGLID